jgi:hypothetical protein
MFPHSRSSPGIVRNQSPFRCHLLKRQCPRIFLQPFATLPQQWPLHLAVTIHLPKRIAAMPNGVDLARRTNAGQPCQFFVIQG